MEFDPLAYVEQDLEDTQESDLPNIDSSRIDSLIAFIKAARSGGVPVNLESA